MALEKTWRWFGERDTVKLSDLVQMGVEGVVTSLHGVRPGEVWEPEQIGTLKARIEDFGLHWSVIESLPVAEGIKTHGQDYDQLVFNYNKSLENIGQVGIDTICYNFMPVLDWARTDLQFKLPSGGEVMYFDYPTFAAFDIYILNRPGSDNDYPEEILTKAERIYYEMPEQKREQLAYNIIVYTQGFIHGSVDKNEVDYKNAFQALLEKYADINHKKLQENLICFLNDVLPTAEKYGIKMCIHPDDPPFPLLGLPRIVSTQNDLEFIFSANISPSNGLTYCTGSLSAVKSNDVESILERYKEKVHFIHLRNNKVYDDGSFHESGHIDGDVDMPAIIRILLKEQQRRKGLDEQNYRMPVRPDHGIKMLHDFVSEAPPGYPLYGRMRGLNEIRGMEAAIRSMELR